MVKIGCCNFSPAFGKNEFVAISCKRGRGVILPGGKHEAGEAFHDTAARELFEETGFIAIGMPKLIFHAMNTDGFYVYTFFTEVAWGPEDIGRETDEGTVVRGTWEQLLRSDFKAYYYLLRNVVCTMFS